MLSVALHDADAFCALRRMLRLCHDQRLVVSTSMCNRVRRYQLDWAGPQFKSMSVDQHVQFAMTDQRDQVAAYLKRGRPAPRVWRVGACRCVIGLLLSKSANARTAQ